MSEKKPTPRIIQPSGKLCPVCGKRSYSPGGIHPQCAVYQADAPRAAKIKADRKLKETSPRTSKLISKECPKCGGQPHVRRKVCDCGHVFF